MEDERLLRRPNPTETVCRAVLNVLLGLIVIALLLTFYTTLTYTLCIVDGNSMLPGLRDGQYVLVKKNSTIADVSRGDVVICRMALSSDEPDAQIIKRAVAVEGDTVRFERAWDGGVSLFINGEEADESYINGRMEYKTVLYAGVEMGWTYTVPARSLYVLGDNRNDSTDSRVLGFVTEEHFVGKVERTVAVGSLEESYLGLVYGLWMKSPGV